MSESNHDVVLAAFTELAPSYTATIDRELRQFWGVSYAAFLERFLAKADLRAGEAILDIATGTAQLPARILARLGAGTRPIGLDITPSMLRQAQDALAAAQSADRVGLICGSGMALPLASGTLDVVTCALGTHHMDVPALVAEVARVLRPGGRAVLADVAATPFWRSLFGIVVLRVLMRFYGLSQRSARAQAEIEAFDNLRTASEWQTLLAAHGFTAIESEELPALRLWYPGGIILTAIKGVER